MLVRSGCVGPRYGVPIFRGGEGWVGRTLDVFVEALGARKELFRVQGAVEVTEVRFEYVPGVG